jgi:predicted phage terminase large subunit-like protein
MLWGSYKTELHKIKAFLRQCSRMDLVAYLYDTYEYVRDNKAILTTQIEGNFAQDELFRDEIYAEGIRRGYQLPYTFDTRKKKDKFERIESTSPHYQNHNVFWNEDEKNTEDMIESRDQLLAIEPGSSSHDDGPDADEGAIYFLMEKRRAAAFEPRGGTYKSEREF